MLRRSSSTKLRIRQAATRCLVAIGLATLSLVASAVVPTPTVTGPIPSDVPGSLAHNYPFFSTDIVLKNFGYVEEEFFYDGTANSYTNVPITSTAAIATSGNPYRSRLLVRRPATAARFNGVVIVEWSNVTNGYDTDVLWLYEKEFYLREGYAWVGVSAQNAGLNSSPNGIRLWSPARYGSLDVTAGGTRPNDVLSYDIFSQAATAVRNVPAVMGGLPVQLVIGAGQSQSATRLGTYINSIHVRDPIYDAFMITEGGGNFRTDLPVPVVQVLSEQERNSSFQQPDTDKVRVWPVAGVSHSEQYSLLSRAGFLLRDLGLQAFDTCATPARSRVEARYVFNAATDAVVKWVRAGIPPPNAPDFQFSSLSPITVARDAFGNALGAIRLAEMEAPVAKEAADSCGLGGTHIPFDTATLNGLYPTHAAYVSKVTQAANAAVAAGFMLAADAQQTIDKAQKSIWGLGLECGPLCADVRQFPLNPSSMLLRNQTAFLLINGAEFKLLPILDAVTLAIAEGYTLGTGTAASKQKFAQAASLLQTYFTNVQLLLLSGNTKPETATLLRDQATTLRNLVLALSV
jgi:alpha/beta hydrolase family protein